MAAIIGFWKARGLSPHTIKLRVQHITQAQGFITSRYCPKQPSYVPPHEDVDESKAWWKNLSAKVLAEAMKAPKHPFNMHLWEAWEFARLDYIAFLSELKVRNISHACHACALMVSKSHHPCRLTSTCITNSWLGGAKRLC